MQNWEELVTVFNSRLEELKLVLNLYWQQNWWKKYEFEDISAEEAAGMEPKTGLVVYVCWDEEELMGILIDLKGVWSFRVQMMGGRLIPGPEYLALTYGSFFDSEYQQIVKNLSKLERFDHEDDPLADDTPAGEYARNHQNEWLTKILDGMQEAIDHFAAMTESD